MEKYLRAEIEVVEFEAEDIIATSGCASDCSAVGTAPDVCGADGNSCFDFGGRG